MTALSLVVKAAPIIILRYSAFTLIALTMHTASGFLVCWDHLGMQQGGLGGDENFKKP